MASEPTRRPWPAWLVGLLASVATVIALVGLGVVVVLVWPGNEQARMARITEGACWLSLFVGVIVGLLVRRRRARRRGRG